MIHLRPNRCVFVMTMLLICCSLKFQVLSSPALAQGGDEDRSIAFWITQLSDDHFLRRQTAEQKLIQAGPDAVDDLVGAMRSGDLESIERAASALTQIAMDRHPSEDGGSWKKLSELSRHSAGRVASAARQAAGDIQSHRSDRARTELTAAGVFIGIDEFMIRAISSTKMIVQIDEKWRGDIETLHWLRWLDGIESARVRGVAIKREVLEQVIAMPKLSSLSLVDGTLEPGDIEPLLKMKPVRTLEFRYVQLSDDQAIRVAKIPIRDSLSLMGTGVSEQRVASMRQALPGLTIDRRQGGFLGVKCVDNGNQCEINAVVEGSAAEDAGLIRNDVIVKVNDAEIKRFSDLQSEINLHVADDQITVHYRRGGVVKTTKVTLRRLLDR